MSGELHIDRATCPRRWSATADRTCDLCKAWRVRNAGGRFAKDQFSLDFAAGQLTCPAGVSMPFEPGTTVRSPPTPAQRARCGHLHRQQQRPQRAIHPTRHCWPSCATASTPGRTREAARTRRGARPGPRRALAGPPRPLPRHRKNLFDRARAVDHNLHVIASSKSPSSKAKRASPARISPPRDRSTAVSASASAGRMRLARRLVIHATLTPASRPVPVAASGGIHDRLVWKVLATMPREMSCVRSQLTPASPGQMPAAAATSPIAAVSLMIIRRT